MVREIEAGRRQGAAVIADVADAPRSSTWRRPPSTRFGRIDYLVNNAALRREKPLEEMTLRGLARGDERHASTARSTACTPACRICKASGAGAIINIGGMSGHTGSKHRVHVVTAKSGLVGFTRALAQDLARRCITVNLVVPGLIGTPRDRGAASPRIISAITRPDRPARQARGRRHDGALSLRPRRALHDRPDHPCERRGLSGLSPFPPSRPGPEEETMRLIFAALLAMLGAQAFAAELPANYPASYKDLVAAAEKEGRVVIYSNTEQFAVAPVLAAFEKAFPKIKVDYAEIKSSELFTRFVSEAQAGALQADIMWSSSMDLQFKLLTEGYAQAYVSPEKARSRPGRTGRTRASASPSSPPPSSTTSG